MKKINKILLVANLNKFYYPYYTMRPALKNLCKEIICFDYRKIIIHYGKDYMNNLLLKVIAQKKPDYILFILYKDEISPETLIKIKELSPDTKTMNFFGDDDTRYEISSRYYSLLTDYSFVVQKPYIPIYKKEGIKNVFFSCSINTNIFRPLNLEKKYDVTFIGEPKSNRLELIKYLKNNGVNLRLYGRGWYNYPDLKDIYGGILNEKELIEVINKSKINLCFSRNMFGKLHIKGRIFEMGACASFSLVEYCPYYSNFFKDDREIVMFKNKKDLLHKINYYLKNEEEREKIARNTYKKVIQKYNLNVEFKNFFKKTLNDHPKLILPKINKKIATLSFNELNQSIYRIKKKLKDADYITFITTNRYSTSDFKDYFQAYSLKKSNKDISCCDYYIHSKRLGDYLLFESFSAFRFMPNNLPSFIDVNQLMVTKKYFFNNFNKIKELIEGKKPRLINDKNTVFVSIPLIRVKEIPTKENKIAVKAFAPKFLFNLYSLKYKHDLSALCKYIAFLIFEIIKRKKFIIHSTLENLSDRNKIHKLIELNK